ncbi:MAG TPA: hypothetical protein VOA41_17185 [Candidatus Dormibacteraeota bacterium]|nr:hypothetical protein [Candidatus Dormibacteraeota bacterium]
MRKNAKNAKAKQMAPVEEAIEKIVAMMEDSAQSLPPAERAAVLEKIREIAAATVAESHAEALQQEQVPPHALNRASGRGKKT